MIPCVGVKIRDKTYYPLYNIRAMFRLQDDFPPDITEKIDEDTKAGFELAFRVFDVLCEEGAAVRNRYGYEPGDKPDLEEFETEYQPRDILTLKNAVYAAIIVGNGQELPKNEAEETDIWLVELEKKTR